MANYQDWIFFISAGLAVLFMIWVFFKFSQQLAGPEKLAKRADADSTCLRVVQTATVEEARASAQDA